MSPHPPVNESLHYLRIAGTHRMAKGGLPSMASLVRLDASAEQKCNDGRVTLGSSLHERRLPGPIAYASVSARPEQDFDCLAMATCSR